MSPIITHEDELELAKQEKAVVSQIKKVAKLQSTLVDSQKKLADNITKAYIGRETLNRTMRDLLKQMQVLAREHRSNVKDEEIEFFQAIVRKNDEYIEASKKYLNAIKDLAVKKEYFIEKKNELADALTEVANKRSVVIKKALNIEKTKNKLIEGEKLDLLDQELNDAQRDFDRARDIFLKQIDQFLVTRDELDELWRSLKDALTEMS